MDKYSEGSLDPFLSQDDDHVTIRQSKRYSGKSQGVKRNGLLVAVLLCLVYISIGLTYEIAWSAQHNCSRQRDSRFTLTGDILEYEDRKEWYKQGHPWDLPPSDEIDEAWDKLLFSLNIRVSPEEMSSIGANTTNRVQVNHGDYLGALGVFHYLHCLNNLRKVIHWDYYGPSLEGVPTMGKEHSSNSPHSSFLEVLGRFQDRTP
ncbi:hypothetical protein GQX73_g10846 [Xylaria multiplex]|uniref:Uncharacterized protein n=1 Tax=Xylaria multiplex TaxID=323545 RepID=A0A7C8IKN9_9PEZI|nr:hypothetical protein GQX73_g10846 [Xylaria multiplex]